MEYSKVTTIDMFNLQNIGRKPALTESLFQVFVAPFFLALEVLFVFGYRKDLFDKVETRIAEKIKLLDSKKKKM
jgi:uncharacterized membrane protein YGL010W